MLYGRSSLVIYFMYSNVYMLGFPAGSDSRESACNVGDLVQSLGREDPLEEGTAPHSSILACRIAWSEEPGGLQSAGSHSVNLLILNS